MNTRAWVMSDLMIRALWIISLLVFISLAVWSVVGLGNRFNQTDFGAGMGMVFAGGGIGIKLHSGTGPGV